MTQAAFQQLKLQQAQQNADRAEQVARSLQIKAAAAQREANRAQENARTLSVESNQAQNIAGRARQGVAMIRSVSEMKAGLEDALIRVTASAETVDASTNVSTAAAPAVTAGSAPVINTSGQVTGTRVNTVA